MQTSEVARAVAAAITSASALDLFSWSGTRYDLPAPRLPPQHRVRPSYLDILRKILLSFVEYYYKTRVEYEYEDQLVNSTVTEKAARERIT